MPAVVIRMLRSTTIVRHFGELGPLPALVMQRSGTDAFGEIVEINLYGPAEASSVMEEGRVAALGHAPITLRVGESI